MGSREEVQKEIKWRWKETNKCEKAKGNINDQMVKLWQAYIWRTMDIRRRGQGEREREREREYYIERIQRDIN